MIELSEPQIWVLIGVFATAIFGMIGVVTTSFNRNLITAIGSVEKQVESLREVMDARFTGMERQIAALDRDVQSIAARVFREDTPS